MPAVPVTSRGNGGRCRSLPLCASRRLRRRAPFNGSRAEQSFYRGGWGSEGKRFLCEEIVECLLATQYGADVERSMGGRCELYYAVRGEWWATEGSSSCPGGSFGGDKGE